MPVKNSDDPLYEERLRNAIKKSYCIADVLKLLYLDARGYNYKTIKKYIKIYNIDISHFEFKKTFAYKNYNVTHKVTPLIEILVENGHMSSGHLKNRLYKEGIKQRICELCGQDENWRGKKFALILDHINGDSTDNRLENLQIVCPNCNAALDTHCGKGKKHNIIKKIFYCDCGKEKTKRANKCLICAKKDQRKVKNRPGINELIKDINELGYVATGKKYDVTDNAVRKWLK